VAAAAAWEDEVWGVRRLNRSGRGRLGVQARGGDGEGGGDLAETSRIRSGVPVGRGEGDARQVGSA
jgi:hypothetical protein